MMTARKILNALVAVAFGVGAGSYLLAGVHFAGWVMLLAALVQAAAFGRLVDQ